jgi:hypothetical protein
MLGLAAPSSLARKAVDVLAQTPADILTVLLLLGYIGTVAESSTTSILSSTDLLVVGQRWRLLKVPMGWDFNRVHVWAASTLVKEELGWEVGSGSGYPFKVRLREPQSWMDDSRTLKSLIKYGYISLHHRAVAVSSNSDARADLTQAPRTPHRLYLAPRRPRQGVQPRPQPHETDPDAPL